MSNIIQPQIKKINFGINDATFLGALQQSQVIKKIQPQMIDYFSYQTENVVRTQSEFLDLKNKINICLQNLKAGTKSVRKYFEGYELLLETRTFFLGKLGEITYTFVVALEGKLIEINIDTKTLIELIFKNKKFGLSGAGDTLRFNASFKHNLQNYLYDILVNETGFELIINNKKVGLKFENPSWMIAQLNRIRSMRQKNYIFSLNLEATKNGIKWIYQKPTTGSRYTSSVFSAVGHYAIDEINAKNEALSLRPDIDKTVSQNPNIGNLTEIYRKAKNTLNNGRNVFSPKQHVYGENLFNIFQEVRSNTDPFYAGGDELEQQIKSLLGSMPSLASFKTIKKELQNLQRILNKESLQQIKIQIQKMFIKNIEKMQNGLNSQQKQLAILLKETLEKMAILT